MSIPRSIYAFELPDGMWEVVVGELGGEQWRWQGPRYLVPVIVSQYVADGSRPDGPSPFVWTRVLSGGANS